MSWYNSLKDLTGDIGDNLRSTLDPLGKITKQTGGNQNSLTDRFSTAKPLLYGAGAGAAADALGGLGGSGTASDTPPPGAVAKDASGNWLDSLGNIIKNNAGAILSAGGAVLQGKEQAAQAAAQLAEKIREAKAQEALQQQALTQQGSQFARTTGNTEAQQANTAQQQLNRAPIADKAQALLLARMGVQPSAFQPRDYTQGLSNLQRAFTAPGANVAQAAQQAAANYQPGQGGVNTSTTQALLNKLKASSGLTGPPVTPSAQPVTPSLFQTAPSSASRPSFSVAPPAGGGAGGAGGPPPVDPSVLNVGLAANQPPPPAPTPSNLSGSGSADDPNSLSLLLRRMQAAY